MTSPVRGRVIEYDDAVRAARARFLTDGRIDMATLAEDLAVGRATLYRVVPSREALLGDVLWRLTERTLEQAAEVATGEGVERLLDVSRRFHEQVSRFPPLRRFVDGEPELAFRVLFTPAAGVHARLVARWAELLRTGGVPLPFDAVELAEVFVRLGESMLWSDLLSGRPLDLDVWQSVRRTLLTTPPA